MGTAVEGTPAPTDDRPDEPGAGTTDAVTAVAAPRTPDLGDPDAADHPPHTSRRRRVLALAGRLLPYLVAAAVTLGVALWTYQPWKFDGAMASTWGDPLAFHTWVQATIEDGWYEEATRLSAPYTMVSHTYTVTDELLFLLIGKVLAPLVGGAGPAVTAWVVLCFPLGAVFAVACARYLGVGRLAALVPGIAFPLLPDHWVRAAGHFSLSSTWAVSLGMLVAITLLRAPRLGRRGRVAFELLMIAAAVAISLTNAYYATFAALLVAVTGVGGAIARRSWAVLATGVVRGLALIVPVVVALTVDRARTPQPAGYSSFEITRTIADAEVYGGKIVAMLLPSFQHRLPQFRAIRNHYDATFPNPAENPALGIVASVGFVGLVVWALVAYFRRRPETVDPRLRPLAAMMWVSLVAYVVGGLGSVWALLLDGGGIRVWSRVHIVIGLIALLAVAVAADRLRGRALRAGAVALVLAVVLVDQTTPFARPHPVSAVAERDEVTAFTDDIAALAGDDAMVFQAPVVTFPIPQIDVAPASIYDGFLPYLYSTGTRLHWSYGGLEGDPRADWQLGISARPFQEAAPMLAAAGFAGVVLDRDATGSLPDLEGQVHAALGEPVLRSTSDRWHYFPLDAAAVAAPACSTAEAQEELAALAVRPPLLYPGVGLETRPGHFGNEDGPAELRVVTLRDGGWPRTAVSFDLDSPTAGVRITFPDGTTRDTPPGVGTISWTGEVTRTETPILIERTSGSGGYAIVDLTASATPSSEVAACLPTVTGTGTAPQADAGWVEATAPDAGTEPTGSTPPADG